jgi:hypothetical protein
MITVDEMHSKPGRRFALILGNGAYTQKAPLSKTVPAALDMQRKLTAMDFQVVCATNEDLVGMRKNTLHWLDLVSAAADQMDKEPEQASLVSADQEPLLLMFVYCGHGSADRLFPIDVAKRPADEEIYCFFEDFLFRLYEVLSFNCRLRRDWLQNASKRRPENQAPDRPVWEWRRWPVQIVSIIESCRRLSKEEQNAFDSQKARIANGRRHLLPCMASLRPDLAPIGGADWDAARLSFLSQLGSNSPQLLLALSSESTTPSYDVVYLRSIVEQIDRPVRFIGMLERARLDTLRKTGHKQKPVLLLLCDKAALASSSYAKLQDLVIAPSHAGPPLLLRRHSSSGNILESENVRLQAGTKECLLKGLNSQSRRSLPGLM